MGLHDHFRVKFDDPIVASVFVISSRQTDKQGWKQYPRDFRRRGSFEDNVSYIHTLQPKQKQINGEADASTASLPSYVKITSILLSRSHPYFCLLLHFKLVFNIFHSGSLYVPGSLSPWTIACLWLRPPSSSTSKSWMGPFLGVTLASRRQTCIYTVRCRWYRPKT